MAAKNQQSRVFKYFTKRLLAEANQLAIKRGYPNALREDFVTQLPVGLKLPIMQHITMEDSYHRLVIAVGINPGDVAMIDCDFEVYMQLPSVLVD